MNTNADKTTSRNELECMLEILKRFKELISRSKDRETERILLTAYRDFLDAFKLVLDNYEKSNDESKPADLVGHWETVRAVNLGTHPDIVIYKCSECGYIQKEANYNYCPNCGAKMEAENE